LAAAAVPRSYCLLLRDAAPTGSILTDVFGFSEVGRESSTISFKAEEIEIGGIVDIRVAGDLPRGQQGGGSVHHIAFRATDDEVEFATMKRLVDNHGIRTTDQKDRNYFRSLYFREPGDVPFEIATDIPGFAVDEPVASLADAIDRRRFILVLEILVTISTAAFAFLVTIERVTPTILLLFMLVLGVFEALEAPSWQAIVPELVPREDLGSAVAANSVGVNISRAIGPALAGIIVAAIGIAAPFWLVAISNSGVIGVFWWWRPRRAAAQALPAERVVGAIGAGLRYGRYNRHLRVTLARSIGLFLFASEYWALLPLIARQQIAGGPELYGILLGSIGAGALAGAVVLPTVKSKIGANGLVIAGEVGTCVALVLYGLSGEATLAISASAIAGMSWIAAISNLNVSAQLSLPDWVRGRGLAMYVTVFFGAMTVGSAIWGEPASHVGLPVTHFIAAAGALVAIPLTARWKLLSGGAIDLSPSMHWPALVVTGKVQTDAGSVMVTVEYRVDPANRENFLDAVGKLAAERKRDGAYAWGIFQDTANEGRFVETFFVESWLEHLRQHGRVTKADRVLEQRVHHLLREPAW
jgi:predicted MFS family arabinose efflux permease/quinol monooxygenase YgiN